MLLMYCNNIKVVTLKIQLAYNLLYSDCAFTVMVDEHQIPEVFLAGSCRRGNSKVRNPSKANTPVVLSALPLQFLASPWSGNLATQSCGTECRTFYVNTHKGSKFLIVLIFLLHFALRSLELVWYKLKYVMLNVR